MILIVIVQIRVGLLSSLIGPNLRLVLNRVTISTKKSLSSRLLVKAHSHASPPFSPFRLLISSQETNFSPKSGFLSPAP